VRLIVAGSRGCTDYEMVVFYLQRDYADRVTEIVSGGAAGSDGLGDRYSLEYLGKPATRFDAAWDNLSTIGAIVKVGANGRRYNANAGFERNHHMAEYGDELAAFWDGISHGTQDMIVLMNTRGKPVKVYRYD
jgi:hypothetical protein